MTDEDNIYSCDQDQFYTNGWKLVSYETIWECGDGCCTEYTTHLELFNDEGVEVEQWVTCNEEDTIADLELKYDLTPLPDADDELM